MHTPCGCLVGRGRFQTCPYVVVWVMVTDPPSARGHPPLASLRSLAPPYAARRGQGDHEGRPYGWCRSASS